MKSAVEYLAYVYALQGAIYQDDIDKAIEMQKEQLILAHVNGQSEFDKGAYRQEVINNAEQYYNETFKKDEQ